MKRPEKKPEYTDNYKKTHGTYSHTKDGKRYYNLEWNQGYNEACDDWEKFLPGEEELRIIIVEQELINGAIICKIAKAIHKRLNQ